MTLSVFELCRKQKLRTELLLSLSAISLFYAVVCTPIFHVLSSDVLLQTSIYPLLLDFIMQFLNYLYFWIAFSYALYAFFRFDLSNCYSIFGVYCGTVVARYLANLIAGFFMTGVPLWKDFVSGYLPYLLIDICLDLAQMGVLIWVLTAVKNKHALQMYRKRGSFLLSNLPFSGMFNFINPIQRAVFWAAVIPASVQLLSQIIFDMFQGLPLSLSGMLWMIFYYLLTVIYLFVGYFVMVLMINRFCLNEEKARLEYETTLPNDSV